MRVEPRVTATGPLVDGSALETIDRSLNACVAEALNAAASAAKEAAPVRKGALRDSIRVEGGGVVADAPHAGPVEFGHVQGKEHPVRVEAHPFLFTGAVEAAAEEQFRKLEGTLESELG